METRVFDLQRIFIGDLPWTFTFEIAFRTAILYIFALVVLRVFMGPRGLGQLSPFEFVIIIALGSAVGDPMFYPDIPLTHGMAVLLVVGILHRLVVTFSNRSDRAEAFIEGKPFRLVKDGRLDLDGMGKATLSREEVFMELRHHGIRQLGEVERAYIEVDGKISPFRFAPEEIRPGLPLIPPWDTDLDRPHAWRSGDPAPQSGDYACRACGAVVHLEAGEKCPGCTTCEGDLWVRAVKEPVTEGASAEV